MRIVFLLALLISCVPEKKSETVAANPASPSRWNTSSFPIILKLSNDFTATEKDDLIDAATSWSDSITNQFTFFDTTQSSTLSPYAGLSDYLDSEMGIYRVNSWPSGLPSGALAITQIFGYRKYLGTSSEHVEIFHADILLNDERYDFSTTFVSNTYDLQTVVIHEMGHFIGLGHVNDPFINTVMYPSVTRSTIYRAPYSHDADNVVSLYGLTSTIPLLANNSHSNGILPPQNELPADTGPVEPVVIQSELYPDGSCVHKENGKITHIH